MIFGLFTVLLSLYTLDEMRAYNPRLCMRQLALNNKKAKAFS